MEYDIDPEDLEAAAELHQNLLAGTHYAPGQRFIGEED